MPHIKCSKCEGSGEVENDGPKACPKCGGNGTIDIPASRYVYKVPIKEKYIDEKFQPLHIFGFSEDGKVDLATADNPCVITLEKEVAEKVVEANQRYMQELYNILGFKQ